MNLNRTTQVVAGRRSYALGFVFNDCDYFEKSDDIHISFSILNDSHGSECESERDKLFSSGGPGW